MVAARIDRIKEILAGPSQAARDATLDSEVASGELQYEGSVRLRNALLHIGRALHAGEEKVAEAELDKSEEELKLAALGSLRAAASALYLSTCDHVVTSAFWRRAALFRVLDDVDGATLVAEARAEFGSAEISCAPTVDGGPPRINAEWEHNLERYRNVLSICETLQSEFPTRREVASRILFALSVVLTVGSWGIIGILRASG